MYNARVSFNERLEEIVSEINTELNLIGDNQLKLYFWVSDFLKFPAISVHYIFEGQPEDKTAEFSTMVQLSLYVRNEDVMTLTSVMKKVYQKLGFVRRNITGYVLLDYKDWESGDANPQCLGKMRVMLDSAWKNMMNTDKEIRHMKLDVMLFYNFD